MAIDPRWARSFHAWLACSTYPEWVCARALGHNAGDVALGPGQQPLTEIERRSVRYRTDVMNDGF